MAKLIYSAEEKIVFSSFVINYVNHHIKVLVGTGLNGTAETIDLSKRVAALEPDALSLVSPYFVAPSQDELIKHYEAVANAVKVPIMLYNMPGKPVSISNQNRLLNYLHTQISLALRIVQASFKISKVI